MNAGFTSARASVEEMTVRSERLGLLLTVTMAGAVACTGKEGPLCAVEDPEPGPCTGSGCTAWGSEWLSTTAADLTPGLLGVGPDSELAVLREEADIVVFDSAGEVLWTVEQASVEALSFAPDGDLLALSYGPEELALVRYDTTGGERWRFTFENELWSPLLAVDAGGTAWFESTLNGDAAIVGVDEQGEEVAILRPKSPEGTGLRFIDHLAVAEDGFTLIVVGGVDNPSGQRTTARTSAAARTNATSWEPYYVQAIDSAGVRQWGFTSKVAGAVPGPCGSFFGVTAASGAARLQRFDTDGTVLWERRWGTDAFGTALAWDGDETLYVFDSEKGSGPLHRLHVDGTEVDAPVAAGTGLGGVVAVRPDGRVVSGVNTTLIVWQ